MKIKSLTIIFCIILLNNAYPQVTKEWVQIYGGPGNDLDKVNALAADDSGNVFVTGYSEGIGTFADITTIKYNSSGNQQWIQRYNGAGNFSDYANAIASDDSGNVYITGISLVPGTSFDIATIKYNTSGIQQWIRFYSGQGISTDEAYAIVLDKFRNVYITGRSTDSSGQNNDFITVKYNSSGLQLWSQRYNGTADSTDEAAAIAVDGSGNVFITGKSKGTGSSYDYLTVKYDSSGIQKWIQRYNGPGNNWDWATSIGTDDSGNVYVTGLSVGLTTDYDFATIKYNSSGVQQWIQRYNGPANGFDYSRSLKCDRQGNIYVTGESTGSGLNFDYVTIKYNSSGVQKWIQRYNSPANSSDISYSISLDSSSNVYVTGGSFLGLSYDCTTIKYDSSGVQKWIQHYNSPDNETDYGYSVATDDKGNVYVGGGSVRSGVNYDYLTIRYSQSTGIIQSSISIPEKFSLSQNYPNPFNPFTTIKFQISKTSHVNILVLDILGREIETIANERMNPGTYEVHFDGSRLASGAYFYKLEADDYSEIRKMIMTK